MTRVPFRAGGRNGPEAQAVQARGRLRRVQGDDVGTRRRRVALRDGVMYTPLVALSFRRRHVDAALDCGDGRTGPGSE